MNKHGERPAHGVVQDLLLGGWIVSLVAASLVVLNGWGPFPPFQSYLVLAGTATGLWMGLSWAVDRR